MTYLEMSVGNHSNPIGNMKTITWIIATAFLLIGCRPSNVAVRPTLAVSCAPEKLEPDQWAILTVLQIYRPGDAIVALNESKLGQVALYALRTKISDPNVDGSGYKLLVYSVKPIGSNALTIDGSFFLNAPAGLRPVTMQPEIKGASHVN
jgi:hypothetical protein